MFVGVIVVFFILSRILTYMSFVYWIPQKKYRGFSFKLNLIKVTKGGLFRNVYPPNIDETNLRFTSAQ